MFNKLIIVFVISLIPFGSMADEVELAYQKANLLYQEGDYENAASLYKDIAREGYIAHELYYNLGNSYVKLDSIPAAILNYERAKKIKPNDEDINYNLKLANLKVVDTIKPLPQLFFAEWWNGLRSMVTSNSWSVYLITFVWLMFLACITFRIFKFGPLRKLSFLSIIAFTIAALISLTFAYQQKIVEYKEQKAIIFSPIVYVKNSPDVNGTDLFIIHDGLKVDLLDEVGQWKKIKLADGNVGWLKLSDIRII